MAITSPVPPGTIYTTYYDWNHPRYYEVVRSSPKSVWLRRLNTHTNTPGERPRPIPGDHTEPAFRRLVLNWATDDHPTVLITPELPADIWDGPTAP